MSLFLMQSCQKVASNLSKPDDLIDREVMEAILLDIYVVSAAKKTIRKKLEKEKFEPSLYILNKYNIEQETFAVSQRWYLEHTDLYLEMLQNVNKELDQVYKFTDETIKKQKQFLEKQKKEASKDQQSCKPD